MQTSYFDGYRGLPEQEAIAICLFPPSWYTGKTCKRLAPTIKTFNLYKSGAIGEKEFTRRYTEETLKGLSAKKVYARYGNMTMLCFEKPGKFCHRHILARWLESKLDIVIEEVD